MFKDPKVSKLINSINMTSFKYFTPIKHIYDSLFPPASTPSRSSTWRWKPPAPRNPPPRSGTTSWRHRWPSSARHRHVTRRTGCGPRHGWTGRPCRGRLLRRRRGNPSQLWRRCRRSRRRRRWTRRCGPVGGFYFN